MSCTIFRTITSDVMFVTDCLLSILYFTLFGLGKRRVLQKGNAATRAKPCRKSRAFREVCLMLFLAHTCHGHVMSVSISEVSCAIFRNITSDVMFVTDSSLLGKFVLYNSGFMLCYF